MVEESDYSTHRVPAIPAPGGAAHARRVVATLADSQAAPRDPRRGGAIGVVLTSDRQLRVVRTTRPRGLRLEGEIDLVNLDLVRRSLASASPEGAEVTVDVTRLGFVDVAGLRLFVECASALAARGGRLVLLGPSRQLLRVLRLCGWQGAPGLHVVPRHL